MATYEWYILCADIASDRFGATRPVAQDIWRHVKNHRLHDLWPLSSLGLYCTAVSFTLFCLFLSYYYYYKLYNMFETEALILSEKEKHLYDTHSYYDMCSYDGFVEDLMLVPFIGGVRLLSHGWWARRREGLGWWCRHSRPCCAWLAGPPRNRSCPTWFGRDGWSALALCEWQTQKQTFTWYAVYLDNCLQWNLPIMDTFETSHLWRGCPLFGG